jgi:hypothetical protein
MALSMGTCIAQVKEKAMETFFLTVKDKPAFFISKEGWLYGTSQL